VNAFSAALVLLAAALLATDPPPRGRLVPDRSRARIPKAVLVAVACAIAIVCAAVASPGLAIAVVLVGATGARRYRRRRRAVRRRRERRRVGAALEVLVGELRAGAHPVSAFTTAAAESAETVARTMLTVASRARLGADVGAGLREAARTSSAPESWERIAVCWDLAARHGLAIATLMAAAQQDIVSRQRFSDTIHAGLAGARATAAILAALPVMGVLLGGLIGAHPMSFLLHGFSGAVSLTVGIALMCAGMIWSDRIIDRVVS